jgi:hypothetical protein
MMTPHCLGVCSRDAFMDDVRIRTRVGINCGWSLSQLLTEFSEFENALEQGGSPEHLENMICLMGCSLKSSIRRSLRKGQCPVDDMKRIMDTISELLRKQTMAVEVLKRLEEFVLMSIWRHACCCSAADAVAAAVPVPATAGRPELALAPRREEGGGAAPSRARYHFSIHQEAQAPFQKRTTRSAQLVKCVLRPESAAATGSP